jgi:hypothetical protein
MFPLIGEATEVLLTEPEGCGAADMAVKISGPLRNGLANSAFPERCMSHNIEGRA